MKAKSFALFAFVLFALGGVAFSPKDSKARKAPRGKTPTEKPRVDAETDALFSRETFPQNGFSLPYRTAETCAQKSGAAALVIYLHGGSAKGSDNEAQMQEPVGKILFDYLESRGIKAKIVLPQCPIKNDWSNDGDEAALSIKSLADSLVKSGAVDKNRIYLFGGSFGSGGVWKFLDTYPNFFACAMTCAGRPRNIQPKNVAKTPVFCVTGGKDTLADAELVESTISELKSLGADIRFETEPEFDHARVCRESYTNERLDWVFSHVRKQH